MKRILLALLLSASVVASAEKQPFDRYQSVVDRQMFGPLPPGFDPTARPSDVRNSSATERELSQEQEKLKSAIRFSAIDVRPSGEVSVGFSDNSDPKSPKIYFLKVGETRDGWTVKEADAEAATMTIVKDGVEVSLALGGDSGKGNGTTARAGGAEQRPAPLSGLSLRARRRQRQQADAAEQAKAAAAAAEREAERQAQAEQEKQQREAERAEQRQQLLAIQEELKRVREARAAEAEKPAESAETEE